LGVVFKNIMRLIACGLALWITTLIFKDSTFGTFYNLAAASVVLWLVNFTLRPILKILTLPIGCITLGLSGILINALMVYLSVKLIPGVEFVGFWPYFVAALLTSLTTSLLVKK
jgi:putative membrane protein